jgi:hypothetical protein
MKKLDSIIQKFKSTLKEENRRLKKYLSRLLHPIYLVPVKLFTYLLYYLIRLTVKIIIIFLKLILETLIYPFRGIKNFIKSLFIIGLLIYILLSFLVIMDYLKNNYGYYKKFFCSFGLKQKLDNSVVRVVGGYSEGSGFFITDDTILTSFHVIENEPSPKIILADGTMIRTEKIMGDKNADLALLLVAGKYPDLVIKLMPTVNLYENEPLVAAGYPMGTELLGKVTQSKGTFIAFRQIRNYPVGFLQTDISLVEGMSGGPLVEKCGQAVGVNTLGVAGLSMFIDSGSAFELIPKMTDQDIKKISVDPSFSPEEAVKAFYTYIKARRMEEGFKLLSATYLQKTDFNEWSNRFKDIIDVQVFETRLENKKNQTVYVYFATKNWVNGEVEYHYYEGTWQTVFEDDVYKMNRSNIKEIFE